MDMFDEKVLAIVRLVMETMELNELYLPKDLVLDRNSPSMTITYDTDTKQYVFKLKGNK